MTQPAGYHNYNIPWPAHDTLPHSAQDTVGLLFHKITLLGIALHLVNHNPQVLLCKLESVIRITEEFGYRQLRIQGT